MLDEKNFRLHLVSTALVVIAGVLLEVNAVEWLFLLICCGGVLGLEIINSSIEKIVDMVSPEIRPDAGRIKDLSAAAVLVFSAISAICAGIIFLPKIIL